ncbi:DUF429 domain-containing protein [Exiguobacterium antarcticum]|uniref:DUF429 domain-containing protein n=1 Tax=Exiguobacterium antarcticum TaxID=132920 RepID=A0ABT6QXN8_9BACL|nr:DUF429 domain-containing protein [Exiguobacterium antarcticum]AFS71249.1 Hypothetical protein Eab7_2149 [Exiguobacterium antarcticum B7]MDI3233462.1 DUF429 domain-containing protein [Exiguobacterium antarcticum]
MDVTGIDAAKAGWVAVSIRDGQFSWTVASSLADIRCGSVTYIDMPIGLERQQRRVVDQLLREELKPGRTSSIFNAPLLAALEQSDYQAANDYSKQQAGLGLSKQAWYLLPKIRQVRAHYQPGMMESHPEVCFARLTGHPARFNKRTIEGVAERTELLRRYDCPPYWELKVPGVATDDWIDACLLAVAATLPATYLPKSCPYDADGFPLYAALPKKITFTETV